MWVITSEVIEAKQKAITQTFGRVKKFEEF